MIFIKTNNQDEGIEYLVNALINALTAHSKLIWLISGGSNIGIAVNVRNQLPDSLLGRLSVALVDERYGKLGHKNSNHQQLIDAGFNFSSIKFEPVITRSNLDFKQTADDYEKRISNLIVGADIVIGQFGIGSDGHTAGILPLSAACLENDRFVAYYRAADFERITLSFRALKMVDQAYVFAFGNNKRETLQKLLDNDAELEDQPAQIFRQFIKESYIINNMIGDNK